MDLHKSKKSLAENLTVNSSQTPSVSAERRNGTTRRSQTREASSHYRSPSPGLTRSVPKRPISAERKRPPTPPSPRVTRSSTPARQPAPNAPITTERKRPSTPPARQAAPNRPISTERKRPSTPPSPRVTRSTTPARQAAPNRPISAERKRPSTPPSPRVTRSTTPAHQAAPHRPISTERKRSSTPPPRPSTPVKDTELDTRWASRRLSLNKLTEGLWPSTMRSLSASFQSDASPLSISKKEKTVPKVSQKAEGTQVVTKKASSEGAKSPLKGKNAPDQLQFSPSKEHPLKGKKESENSKPANILHSRLVEHHRWPSITGGKLRSSPLTRSVDLTERNIKSHSLRRMSIPDGLSKPSKKTSSDVSNLASLNESVPSCPLRKASVRSQSLPTTPGGSRASSPSKTRAISSTSRGVSPAHSRPSSPCRQSHNSTTSVLSFISDIKKGKKGASHIEDVHEIRLLYNRHLQWRYANARANAALHCQKVKAERMLYNMLETISELWDYVIEKKRDLQQLRLRIKLHTVLREQEAYLEDWSSCGSEHINALSHAIEDLRSSIIRVPVTGGARGDIESVKAVVSSAVDLVQAMGSSISSILARVEAMNGLVSDLADVAAEGTTKMVECEALLASVAALQVEEDSLRTHLIQLKEN